MLEEEVRVDRAVAKEEEESGELRRESSNMYLSISSKNLEHAELVHRHY